ncbi:TonB family protein [Aquicoccus sp. SU-CL01552]|uniref:TonB family protein n=1 Tax=Aquicoccus sp. SU-CL01552 TaxID=3127656 RepID=UPI00333FA8CD
MIALLLAGAAHGVLALALVSQERTEIEGAAGAGEVRLGSSFADMAVGTLSAQRPADMSETAPSVPQPESVQPENARMAITPPAEKVLRPEPATPTAAPRVVQARTAAAPVPVQADAPLRLSAQPPEAAPAQKPTETTRLAPAPDAQPTPLRESEKARKKRLEETHATPHTPAETQDNDATITRSPRPKQRVTRTEPREITTPKPQPQAKPAPSGNAERSAQAGQAAGTERAKAITSGAHGKSNSAGNASASNYPGLIMRKLSRAPRPRMSARGEAVVAFRVASNGGLASVSIARSSGSSALDQAALRVVQRAAPFLPPPNGARRSFSVQIKGR